MSRFIAAAGTLLAVLVYGPAVAEVPPLPKDELTKGAVLIVTGAVIKVEVREKQPSKGAAAKEREYRFTVTVSKIEKGKRKEGAGPLIARGWHFELKRGFVGPTGHRSANTNDRIADVGKGWELRLYLRAPGKDGSYEILSPNGFEVLKKPHKER